MSASAQIPKESQAKGPRRSRRESARTAGLVVLGILITLFAVFNLKQVRVNWIFGSDRAPLILVIVVSALIGMVLGHFAERRTGKRK